MTDDPGPLTSSAFRRLARSGRFAGPTAGIAPGYTQANIVILPAEFADAFEDYARANPAPCPVLARSAVGDPSLPTLGEDIDIRTDLPRYRIFRDGKPAGDQTGIADLWRDDLVTFALGCSLSFEADLVAAGVALRCFGDGAICSAFVSTVATKAVAPFSGPLVVTMRAIRSEQVELVHRLTKAHPEAHGPPVHVGDPTEIGVDLGRPIDGIGLTDIQPGETPVFWACGVTPQHALVRAALPFAVTHAPAHMLVTDRRSGGKAFFR